MTDYAPRARQNLNQFYQDAHYGISQHFGSSGLGYHQADDQLPYTTYSAYTNFLPSQRNAPGMMYLSGRSHNAMPYHLQPPPNSATLPSQSRAPNNTSYFTPISQGHKAGQQLRLPLPPEPSLIDTEAQESTNGDTMQSEPIEPPLDGYPDVEAFDKLMKRYST